MKTFVSNAGVEPLTVWIEPWCADLTLSPRSSAWFEPVPDGDHAALPELEVVDDRLVVWAGGAGTMIVAIDGIGQDTASRAVALPTGMFAEMPVKSFVQAVFGPQPGARPAGAPPQRKRSFLARLLRRAS